ncbi:MAG: TrmH family RNA methyltransferase [Thermodesulfovibrionales bacterium]|nr:TrmH family RNA methyltransferase [Thermodesulfovibrionales bacterium]
MFDIIFDNTRKPINVGVIIRLACATGSKLYFTGNSVDYKNRKARLAAVGYEHIVDLSYEKDFRKLIGMLKAEGKLIVGTSPGSKKLYTEVGYKQPTVFVFGTEACGLSKEKRQLMDEVVYIPMAADVEALNVVNAAAIVLYEGLRQRGFRL